MITLGLPTFFITINPFDIDSSLVLYLADFSENIKISHDQIPNFMKRAQISASNPVACA